MAIFRFVKMTAAAILDFRNFKFLRVKTVRTVKLQQHAKFRLNHSNRGRGITIFRFLQDDGRPPSWNCNACIGDHPRRAFGGLYHCEKFVWNRCSSFDNMPFSISRVWLENAYSRPKIVFFWVFDLLNGHKYK